MAERDIDPFLNFTEGRMSTIYINSYMAAQQRTYAQILVEDFAANEVWPLVNITSGTTILAHVNSARNGTLSGWDLQNAAGPVPGSLAPYASSGDSGNIFTTNLAGIANLSVGSLFCWCKMTIGVWGDASFHMIMELRNNTSIFTFVTKDSSANRLYWQQNGTEIQRPVTNLSTSGWFSVGMSWNNALPERKAFYNGAQVGATNTAAFSPTGSIDAATLGVRSGGSLAMDGHLAYPAVRFGAVWTPAQFADMHGAAATALHD